MSYALQVTRYKHMPKIFIISGPSGAGKTTVAIGALKKLPQLKTTITYTTRPPRLGKPEDKTLIYLSPAKFKIKIKQGNFLEWAKVHNHLYGTDRESVINQLKTANLLMNIDVRGALQIKQKMPKQTILIFIKTSTTKDLIQRIFQREKMPPAVLKMRIANAKKELALAKKYDYIVINKTGRVRQTIGEVTEIIKKEIDQH